MENNQPPDSNPVELPVSLEAELQHLCAEFQHKVSHAGEHFGLQLISHVSIEARNITDQGGQT